MSISNIWGKIFLDNRSCSFVYIENGKGWVNKYSSQPTEGLLFYLPCCSGRSFFFCRIYEFIYDFCTFVFGHKNKLLWCASGKVTWGLVLLAEIDVLQSYKMHIVFFSYKMHIVFFVIRCILFF